MGMQSHLGKCCGSIRAFVHHAPGVVLIFGDYYFIDSTEVKVGEHVTSRETCHQEILGIVPCRVAAKRRIGGCQYRRLSGSSDRIVALVGRVCLCTLTLISGPLNLNLILVLLHDLSLELCGPGQITHPSVQNLSLKYFSPESQRIVTMTACCFSVRRICSATRKLPTMPAAAEIPNSSPHSRARRRAMTWASSVAISIFSSANFGS